MLITGQVHIIGVQKGTNKKGNMQRKEAYIPKMNETKDSDTGIQHFRKRKERVKINLISLSIAGQGLSSNTVLIIIN